MSVGAWDAWESGKGGRSRAPNHADKLQAANTAPTHSRASPSTPKPTETIPQGAAGVVNDAAFTADGARLLAACGDARIVTWSRASGQPGHTLTGHGGGVTCVAASALDAAVAVSAGDDRCVKVWDLHRGFAVRSLLCGKMPTALALSLDGSTILTGASGGERAGG